MDYNIKMKNYQDDDFFDSKDLNKQKQKSSFKTYKNTLKRYGKDFDIDNFCEIHDNYLCTKCFNENEIF